MLMKIFLFMTIMIAKIKNLGKVWYPLIMKEKSQKFIIDVVPLTKIPLTNNQSFSYLWDEKLPVGTLVDIPLFRRKTEGIVIGTRNDFKRLGNIELKKIDKIIEENFLTSNQLELAKYISSYYISPLGVVMKSFVPKRTKLRKIKRDLAIDDLKRKSITLTTEQKKAVDEISQKNKKYLLFGPAASGKTEVYIHSMVELRKQDKELQFLVLVPEKTLTPQAIERYGQYFDPEEIVTLSSNISKGQFYTNWQAVKSGEAKIIIGTRMGVFAPFKKLGLIIIDEQQDISFKQWDMNPRYDARRVAEKLSEIYRCSLVSGSATPSVDSYYQALNDKSRLLKLSELSAVTRTKKEIVLVDMKKERWVKNYSPISKKLQSEIAYALKNKLQTILFINRQGMSVFSICDSCKMVLRCPRCDRALIYDNQGIYRCAHCSHKTSITPKCSRCNGIVFQNVGLGTQKVEKEVLSLFSNARVARIDTQSVRKHNHQKKIYRDFSDGKIDILIGTQMVSKGWDLPRMALIGIIDADNALSLPDFRNNEKVFEDLVQVSGRIARPGATYPGIVIIQTFQPENKLLKLAAEKDFETFYLGEIKERRTLKLPPFGRMIKLVFQDYSLKKVEKEADKAVEVLQAMPGIKISDLQDPLSPKIRGRMRKQIIIKIKEEIPYELMTALRKLGSGWIIDVDPISVV